MAKKKRKEELTIEETVSEVNTEEIEEIEQYDSINKSILIKDVLFNKIKSIPELNYPQCYNEILYLCGLTKNRGMNLVPEKRTRLKDLYEETKENV